MAVETNKGDATVSPAQTLTGVAAVNANGKPRRKRPSSLLSAADSLPSVETSLDEFISRANQTLTDPDSWQAAEHAAKQEDDARREADQLRWRAAEQQLREGEAREQSLRRQLDGLQGRLAEAEARAAVAGSGSQDGVIADLKMRLTRADERIANAEAHAQQADGRAHQLAHELTAARAAAQPPVSTPSAQFFSDGEAEERIRLAEAKAAKAIAAAKAAAAGLTVSPADIAAIESGLVVPSMEPAKGTNWLLVAGAFIGGLAIMFGVTKLVVKNEVAPVAAATGAPAAAAAPAQPTVTPIEDDKPAQAAAAPAPAPAAPTPAETPPAPIEAAQAAAAQTAPEAAHEAPAAAPHRTEPKHAASAPHHAAPAHRPSPAAASGIADPFDSSAAKKSAAKKAEKKPAGGIVDPF